MKKRIGLCLLVVIFFCLHGQSSPIDSLKASVVARNFFFAKMDLLVIDDVSQLSPQLLTTVTENGENICYVFGFGPVPGWVVIAADNVVIPVLAYSMEGQFVIDESLQPPSIISWTKDCKEIITQARADLVVASSPIQEAWQQYMQVPDISLMDTPLEYMDPMLTTRWNQDCNYNTCCPITTEGVHPMGPCWHTYTGCDATAMAQVMKYWNSPLVGDGSYSYTDLDDGCDPSYGDISIAFNTTYNWDDMPDIATTPATGIPKLIFDCGVSIDMDYSSCGSAGSLETASPAMLYYFKYSDAIHWENKSDFSLEEWTALIRTDLWDGLPVLLSGKGSGGHAWVCDGFQDNYAGTTLTYFHMNWGWSGGNDGYYYIESLYPGSENYNLENKAVFRIFPALSDPNPPTNVRATKGVFQDHIEVTWHWSTWASHYKVYRSMNNDLTPVAITDWIPGNLYYEDYDVLPGTHYNYWIQPAGFGNGSGEGGLSHMAMGFPKNPDLLINDLVYTKTSFPAYNLAQHNYHYWCVVGAKNNLPGTDVDLFVYPDTSFGSPVAISQNNADILDYVVFDGHHIPMDPVGVKVIKYSGPGSASLQYEKQSVDLNLGVNNGFTWNAADLVKVFNVQMTPGTYYFTLDIPVGYADLGFALYSSGSGNYFQPKNSSLAFADDYIGGFAESFMVTISAEDDYGLVVYGKQDYPATFNIYIEKDGSWTGAIDQDWHNPYNWSLNILPDALTDVIIPEVENKPTLWGDEAECRSLVIEGGPTNYLEIFNTDLVVYGDFECNARLVYPFPTPSARLIVTGDIYWREGSSITDAAETSIWCYGDWYFFPGAQVQMHNNSVKFVGSNFNYVSSADTNNYFNDFEVFKSPGGFIDIATWSAKPIQINGHLYIDPGSQFYCDSPEGVILKGSLINYGQLLCGNGTFTLNGMSHEIYLNSGDYFNNLDISDSWNTTLHTDVTVKGNLTIHSGVLNDNYQYLYVGGDWNNLAGLSGFNSTGTEVFNGEGHQYCSNEHFNNLMINKLGGAFRVNGSQVVCEYYIFIKGAVDVLSGTFSALSTSYYGIYGNFYLNPYGTINIYNTEGFVDLNANLNIFGGEFNIYGGISSSYWAYDHDASIHLSGGILDFRDVGIVNSNTGYNFITDITGGSVRTSRSVMSFRSDFQPSGGDFEFYGPTNEEILLQNGSRFHDLKINKTGTAVVALASDIEILSSGLIEINGGEFNLNGYNLSLDGYIHINTSGKLSLASASVLSLGNTSGVFVNNGGTLEMIGTPAFSPRITHNSGYYIFNVESGGLISAENAIFEFQNANGINVKPGSLINTGHSFTACTFRNGQPGGTLFTLDNNQDLQMDQVVFPENTWGGSSNVTKNVNSGHALFTSFTGDFSGAVHEQDPYNRINWGGTGGGNGKLAGTLKYDDIQAVPLQGVTVLLKSADTIAAQTLTGPSGGFSFPVVNPGTYTLDAQCTHPWGGVNAADALLIMKHFVQISPLTGLRMRAADLNAAFGINAGDALLAMQRFVGNVNSYVTGDWLFDNPLITLLDGDSITQNIKGLCFGDVNGSFVPQFKSQDIVELIREGTCLGAPGGEVKIPVYVKSDIDPGSISVILHYDQNQFSVNEIIPNMNGNEGADQSFIYNITPGGIRIAWYTLNPESRQEGIPMFFISGHTLSSQLPDFYCDNGSIATDFNGKKIENFKLSIPSFLLPGSGGSNFISVFPNPASKYLEINYLLEKPGVVKLSLFTIPGEEVSVIKNQYQQNGIQHFYLNCEGLSAGMYWLRLIVDDGSERISKMMKIAIIR
ncbi:MAG: C10 family peptidase [Bacteroidetes bacterium]|nr:C10 family peptidase [Bacteroidota bacterium]